MFSSGRYIFTNSPAKLVIKFHNGRPVLNVVISHLRPGHSVHENSSLLVNKANLLTYPLLPWHFLHKTSRQEPKNHHVGPASQDHPASKEREDKGRLIGKHTLNRPTLNWCRIGKSYLFPCFQRHRLHCLLTIKAKIRLQVGKTTSKIKNETNQM